MTETERRDWREYRRTGDVSVRNRLVERHLSLVHHFARRMEPRAGGALEVEDLVSAGTLGLLDAVGAFDPGRGYRFSTFAAGRVRGAMLDEMRRRDTASRSLRRRQKRMDAARERLAVSRDRAPTDPELAEVLEVGVQTVWRWKWDVVRARRVSLDVLVAQAGGSGPAGWQTAGSGSIEERLTLKEELARLALELPRLPERERLIVRLYDLEGRTLREIGERLGVSESRVSQLRRRALGRLRERLSDLREAA